jgi:hypothetical protein
MNVLLETSQILDTPDLPATDTNAKTQTSNFNATFDPEKLDAIKSQIENPAITPMTDEQIFERLAELPPRLYDQFRQKMAKRLKIRTTTLDAEVNKRRRQSSGDQLQGSALDLADIELWPETVSGADVLSEVVEAFSRYVALPDGAADSLALWTTHAHGFESFVYSPRLNISSPEKGCGKTTLRDVLAVLLPRPLATENLTVAVLFRVIESHKPTLLADECDASLKNNEELRGMLNAGHKRGGKPLRAVSERVWVNAQLGLMETAKAINARNAGIKIFAAIRLEAFTSDVSSTHTQNKDLCTILKYNDDDLKNIFEANIRLMRREGLVKPQAEDSIQRFLGFKEILHPHIKNADGSPKSEDIFKYILRHTLRRPRELLLMGQQISQIHINNRDASQVRKTVNKVSTDILHQYKNEIVPFWNEDESTKLLSNVHSKVITSDKAKSLLKICPNALAAFFRRGLLGVVESAPFEEGLIQTFLPAAERFVFLQSFTVGFIDQRLICSLIDFNETNDLIIRKTSSGIIDAPLV